MPLSILPVNVRDLLYCQGVESERVEFKAPWDARTTGPQVLRTICAFANECAAQRVLPAAAIGCAA